MIVANDVFAEIRRETQTHGAISLKPKNGDCSQNYQLHISF
jgi:hypothetical protein